MLQLRLLLSVGVLSARCARNMPCACSRSVPLGVQYCNSAEEPDDHPARVSRAAAARAGLTRSSHTGAVSLGATSAESEWHMGHECHEESARSAAARFTIFVIQDSEPVARIFRTHVRGEKRDTATIAWAHRQHRVDRPFAPQNSAVPGGGLSPPSSRPDGLRRSDARQQVTCRSAPITKRLPPSNALTRPQPLGI